MGEDEVMKVLASGKRRRKAWKRVITKHTFVGETFTRKPPKFERFIRPMALRSKKAHVTHPEVCHHLLRCPLLIFLQLKATFNLPIIGVKKNPSSPLFTQLGVITKGTILEVRSLIEPRYLSPFKVNVSELGLVTTGGKVVWGKYAQVTNNPENDGCINAVLLV
jgi:ribosome biogenesis protein NSA2